MAMVLFLRLDSSGGFSTMGDAMNVAHKFREKGINAVAEPAPGDPLKGFMVYYIKVPEEQREEARKVKIDL